MREVPIGFNAAIAVCTKTLPKGFIIVDGKVVNASTSFCLRCNAEDPPQIEVEADMMNQNYIGEILDEDFLECAKTLMMIPTKNLVEELEKREGVAVKTLDPGAMAVTSIAGPARLLTVTD